MAVRLPSIFSRNKPQTQTGGSGAIPPIKPPTAVGGMQSGGSSGGRPSGAPLPPSVTGKPLLPSNGQPIGFQSNGLDNRMQVDSFGRVSQNTSVRRQSVADNRWMDDQNARRATQSGSSGAMSEGAASSRRRANAVKEQAPENGGAVKDSAGKKHNSSMFTAKAAERAGKGSLRPPSVTDNKPAKPAPKREPSTRPAAPPPPRPAQSAPAKGKGRRGKG